MPEASLPGQPTCLRNNTPERKTMNPPAKILSDDQSSDLILLKDLKPQTFMNPEKRQDNLTQEQMEIKQKMPRKDETDLEKEREVYHSLIDLDSAENNQDQNTTPPLIHLDSYEEGDISNAETTNTRQNPEVKSQLTFQNTELVTKMNKGEQTKDVTTIKNLTKLTGAADRKAFSPMKLSPRKLSDTYSRHNTRPIRTRQPPMLLVERIFTSLVETADDRPGEHKSTRVSTPPYTASTEAITMELESHQMDIVDLTSPSTSSSRHPIIVNLSESGSEQTGNVKPSISLSPIGSPKKVQFRSDVHKSEFYPSGLPSEPADAILTPIVFNPDWLNTNSIISAMELLSRPMTLDEVRRWTVNQNSSRDAA